MNYVTIKSYPSGLTVKMDKDADFELISTELVAKFKGSAKFFGKSKLVVSFEGRELDEEEERFLVKCIEENTEVTVSCLIGKNEETEERYLSVLNCFAENGLKSDCQFYKGSVKADETITADSSIVVLGDVNTGANVNAAGNVIILGTLMGHAHAGNLGNDKSFIVALDIKPTRVRIADFSERVGDKNGIFLKNKAVPKIIYVKDKEIVADAITEEKLYDLPF